LSDDIVAIDKASLDLITQAKPLPQSKAENLDIKDGQDIFSLLHGKDSKTQIETAEKFGLGTSNYQILEV
jgi:hypothetical protein